MSDSIAKLLDTAGFPPRWHCGVWTPVHGWTHIVSDVAIFGAYFAIPIALAILVVRRKDVPFPPLFWLFGAFILSCGIGHLIESTLFWRPWYRLSALVKVVTALVSWATVLVLLPNLPRALALPGLAAVNDRLEREARERERTERELRERTAQLEGANHELSEFAGSILGREERIIELKQEVNALLGDLGRAQRYSPAADVSSRA